MNLSQRGKESADQKRQARLAKASTPKPTKQPCLVQSYDPKTNTYTVTEGGNIIPNCTAITNGTIPAGQPVTRKDRLIDSQRAPQRIAPPPPPPPRIFAKVLMFFDANPFANINNNTFFDAIYQFFGQTRIYLVVNQIKPVFDTFLQRCAEQGAFFEYLDTLDAIPADLDGLLILPPEASAPPIIDPEFQSSTTAYFTAEIANRINRIAQRTGVLAVGEWANPNGITFLPWNRALFRAFGFEPNRLGVIPTVDAISGILLPLAEIVDERFGSGQLASSNTCAAYTLPSGATGIARIPNSPNYFVGILLNKINTPL